VDFNFEQFWRDSRAHNWPTSLILCFFTGFNTPDYSTPMLRDPEPYTGDLFSQTFLELYRKALHLNPAVHDGAVMIGRATRNESYRIAGWSYRLFPPEPDGARVANCGSAINSCIAMSIVATVDTTYKITDGRLSRFISGRMHEVD
jgi:hypothetical protein